MITPLKKEIELRLFNRFRKDYVDFPDGDFVATESPDFIIEEKGKKIGLEFAEVFQDSNIGDSSKLMQLQSIRERVGYRLVEALKSHANKHFSLGIVMNEGVPIAKGDIDSIVDGCIGPCLDFILNAERESTIIQNYFFSLPAQVWQISITVWPSMKQTYYNRLAGGAVGNMDLSHIAPTLLKHEKAMLNYQPCDEYWIVIHEGSWHAGTFDEIVVPKPIQSNFDKVFVYRRSTGEIIILK